MAESTIPVDLFNPGQVFACLGLMEAAEQLFGRTESRFDWEGDATFSLRAATEQPPVGAIMAFIANAHVEAYAPAGSANTKTVGQVAVTLLPSGVPYPFPDPDSSATLASAIVGDNGVSVPIDHWGDATRRDNVKFWAGSGGYAGAALARDALALIPEPSASVCADPFSVKSMQSSSFRFDWRRDYIPLDAGFSPNRHGQRVVMTGYPIVELFAAIGLAHARPLRAHKLAYHYGVCGGVWLTASLIRASLGRRSAPVPTAPFRCFDMQLGWPGQAGQARCITQVTEEIT